MTYPIPPNLPPMTEEQRAAFYASYNASAKNETTGVLLAVFLGGFGAHHFYLRRTGLGILYLIFGVTGIPWIIALVEAFLMPGRVREFNAQLAAYLAAMITGRQTVAGATALPAPPIHCGACGAENPAGVRFCSRCGHALTTAPLHQVV